VQNTKLQIPIINHSNNQLPSYQTIGAAGMDICAFVQEPIIIAPMQRALIPTGLHIALPQGMEAQVRPRSGLAIKNGITLLNSPGTIDSDYRGEIKIILINLGADIFTINNGDRIAQMVIATYHQITWQATSTITETERASGGFGHTGV
jgi:dUTP pyrophosphatase